MDQKQINQEINQEIDSEDLHSSVNDMTVLLNKLRSNAELSKDEKDRLAFQLEHDTTNLVSALIDSENSEEQ